MQGALSSNTIRSSSDSTSSAKTLSLSTWAFFVDVFALRPPLRPAMAAMPASASLHSLTATAGKMPARRWHASSIDVKASAVSEVPDSAAGASRLRRRPEPACLLATAL